MRSTIFKTVITFPGYGSDNGNYSNGKMSMIMIIVMIIIKITKTAIVMMKITQQ